MALIIIAVVAFLGSLLTFYSGFGLGTILLPVLIYYYPLQTAIALTALIHFLNNLFKIFLVGFKFDRSVLLKFGIPSMLASFLGAYILIRLNALNSYHIVFPGFDHEISPVKMIIGTLLIIFAILEYRGFKPFSRPVYFLGGLISGFFGGLSGHQGALRSAFLVNTGIKKESFIATGIGIALMVDIARLILYGKEHFLLVKENSPGDLIIPVVFAFAGAYLGNRFLEKVSFEKIKDIVGVFLFLTGIFLILNLI